MSRTGIWIPLLALASVFFGWRAYDAWTSPAAVVRTPQSRPAAVPIGVSRDEAPPPADLSTPVVSIVARPVFRPDRKPFREEAALLKRNYDAELARFTLLGVLLRGEDKKGVVVGKGAAGRDERWEVGPGDTLPGFTVKDVGADGMTLAADDKEFLLPLYAGGPKAQPGRAPLRTETAPPVPAAPAVQAPPPAGGAPGVAPPAAHPAPPPAAPPAAVAPAAPATPLSPGGLPPDYYRRRPRFMPGRNK